MKVYPIQNLLINQTAIVTGGTLGIGKAIAIKLAEQGARVAIFGTHEERGIAVVQELEKLAPAQSPIFFKVDVSQTQEVQAAVKKVLELFQRVDILVNNAGITCDKLLMKMSEEDWDRVIAVNLKSCYNTCQALVRAMMKARQGKIINISSVVGIMGNAGQTNYAASKAAIIGLTKSLAKELASRHICVNCIAPGFIETGMTSSLPDAQKQALITQIPLGRMGLPEEIGNAVLFLASYLADYMTGQVLTVDGGMVM